VIVKALRLLLAAGGAALIGWGVYGMLHDAYIRDPKDVLIWALSGLVIHDALWMPLVLLVGAPLGRLRVLRGGLMVAVTLTAVAVPAVLRVGQNHGNSTLLPLPYVHNLQVVLEVVGALTLVAAIGAWSLRQRPSRRAGAAKRGAPSGRHSRQTTGRVASRPSAE
jgi:hypothetical protein